MNTDSASDGSEFDQAFDAIFGYIAFVINRHPAPHMLRSSRTLGVDYETSIVWGVLAYQNVAHLMPPGGPPIAAMSRQGYVSGEGQDLRAVRVRDLQQITGIPRETVRRKLEALSARAIVRAALNEAVAHLPAGPTPKSRSEGPASNSSVGERPGPSIDTIAEPSDAAIVPRGGCRSQVRNRRRRCSDGAQRAGVSASPGG